MDQFLEKLPEKAIGKKRTFKIIAQKVRRLKPGIADELFRRLHHEAFQHIDCLLCANCCKGLGPRLQNSDIRRLSSRLKMSTTDFMHAFIKTDEDGDLVFKNMPCPFLGEDNYCGVYESRPKACREYPHTDQKNIRGILSVCVKNTETCPAVFYIFESIQEKGVTG